MDQNNNPDIISFHYVKTNDYRTVLTTGAIGGVNIQGQINMNFYTDRPPLPTKVSYKITNNKLAEEVAREIREGGIREIQFGALFDVPTAKELVKWINTQIELIEEINKNK